MKTKLYRVLVLLVAIAMMIPSFAFAEDPTPTTPTLTLSGTTKIEKYFDAATYYNKSVAYGMKMVPNDVPDDPKYTVAGIPEGTTNGEIVWTIDNPQSFTFSDNGGKSGKKTLPTSNVQNVVVPSVYLTKHGFDEVLANAGETEVSATISAQLSVDYNPVGNPVEFTVKVKKFDVKGIKFTEEIGKDPTVIDIGSGTMPLPIADFVDIEFDESAEIAASYRPADVWYKITEGGDYALVNRAGKILFQKPTPEGKRITVVAYIPGSANASLEKSKAVHHYTVIGENPSPAVPTTYEDDAYQFIAFTTGKEGKIYTTSSLEFTLHKYSDSGLHSDNKIKTIPEFDQVSDEKNFTDKLDWAVDKPQYAHIQKNTDTGEVKLVFDVTDPTAEIPDITVTVASTQNPDVKDSCIVRYTPVVMPETEDEGYTKLAFQPFTETTILEGNPIWDPEATWDSVQRKYIGAFVSTDLDLKDYLVAKKDQSSKDSLLWSDDKNLIDPLTGIIDSDNLLAKYSPVTVTVCSKMHGDDKKTFTLNIVKALTPDQTYTSVKFAVSSVTTGKKTKDIFPYLVTEGNGSPYQLIFTSSDRTIATVTKAVYDDEAKTYKVTVKFSDDAKSGDKVTIEVRNGATTEAAETSTLEVTYLENEEEQKQYKVGFTKKSLDVSLSESSINLKDYVYVKNADGTNVSDTEAEIVIGKLIWNTDNAAVATVTSGYVYPKKAGTATISMRTGYSVEKAETITLNIKDDEETVKDVIKGIKFNTDKEIEVLEGYGLNAFDYLIFTDMDGKEVTNSSMREAIKSLLNWTSTDQTVATVSDSGSVTANKEGSTTINVRYNNGQEKQTASLKIKVVKAESKTYTKVKFAEPNPLEVHIDEQHYTFDASKYLALEGKGSPTDLKWSSSDTNIATVDEDGIVSFGQEVSAGTAKLFAKDGDSVKITVTCPDADPALEPATLTLNIKYEIKPYTELKFVLDEVTVAGNINDLGSYLVTKGNEFYQDELIWTSSNQQIAKVKVEFQTPNGNANRWAVARLIWGEDVQDGDKVDISVRSKLNKDDKASAKIRLIYDDKRVAIQKMELTQAEFKLDADDAVKTFYLDRYVKTTPAEHDDKLIFTSDDPSVVITNNEATVKIDAALMGEEGTAHITVRSMLNPDATAQFTFKVEKVAATSIKFVDAPTNFYRKVVGTSTDGKEILNTLTLTEYLVTKPADFDTANLVWESSDPTVAKVNNNGVVTYVQAGKVTITATDKVGGKSDKVELTLGEKHPVESIALKDITMEVGDDPYELSDFLTVKPLNAVYDEDDITWTSSNRDVAEVIKNEGSARKTRGPVLKAYKAGTTKITAYYELEDGKVLEATATVTVNDVELEKVKIAEDKYILKLNTKKKAVVRFNVEPFNCTFEQGELYIVSADPEIVEVSGFTVDTNSHKGKFTITGKKPGTAWVVVKRAKDDKALDACKVKVKAVAVKSVGWEKKNVKMYYYDDGKEEVGPVPVKITNKVYRNKLSVTPIINPAKAYCNVSFETSDPSVAFINDDDVVDFLNDETPSVDLICMGPGKCKITMKVDDGKKVRKAVMNVEVETKLPKLKLSEKRATLKLEKGKDILQLRAYDANTDTDLEVKWASSNTKVAKVNVDGKVRAVGAGTATITATTKNGQKQVVKCKIVVKAPSTKNDAAKKITGDTKVTVKAGEKKALEIKVKPEGAKVTFTSSDSKIVKVTKDGTIKGIKAGKATITVKAAEGKAELKIKVVVK